MLKGQDMFLLSSKRLQFKEKKKRNKMLSEINTIDRTFQDFNLLSSQTQD